MRCVNCESDNLTVMETINQPKATLRLRRCADCGAKFYTKEEVVPSEEVKPVFDEWTRERSRKCRAKKKGEEYNVKFEDGREQPATPKKPTSPLF